MVFHVLSSPLLTTTTVKYSPLLLELYSFLYVLSNLLGVYVSFWVGAQRLASLLEQRQWLPHA